MPTLTWLKRTGRKTRLPPPAPLESSTFPQIVEEERRRFGLELHDGPVQTLTKLLGVLEVREQVSAETRALAEELLRQMRLLIQFSYIPDEFPRGIAAAIENLAQGIERSAGVPVTFYSDEGCSRLDAQPEGTAALYRIAQEALANVLKHSHATKVAVHMEAVPDFIALRVEDDGVGFDANRAAERPGRLGLLGMRHRAASVGGKLEITSAMGRGTTDTSRGALEKPDC